MFVFEQEMMQSIHSDQPAYVPDELYSRFPSLVRVDMLNECHMDPTAHRRLLAAAIMALKTHGSHGLHACLQVGDRNAAESLHKLNLYDIPLSDKPEHLVILGRAI